MLTIKNQQTLKSDIKLIAFPNGRMVAIDSHQYADAYRKAWELMRFTTLHSPDRLGK